MKHSIKQYMLLFVAITGGLFAMPQEDILRDGSETFQPEEYQEYQKAKAYQAFLSHKLENESLSKKESSKEEFLKGFDLFVEHQDEDMGVYTVELVIGRPYEAFTTGFMTAHSLKETEWRTTTFEVDFTLVRQEIENAFDGVPFTSANPKFKQTEIVYRVALEHNFDADATRRHLQTMEWNEVNFDPSGDTYEIEKMRFNKMFGHGVAEMVKWLNKDREFPLIDGASFLEGLERFNVNATSITTSDIRAYITEDDSSDENLRKEMSYAIGGGLHMLLRSSNCVYFDNYVITRQFSESSASDITLPYEKEYDEKYRDLYRSHTTSELVLAIKMKTGER